MKATFEHSVDVLTKAYLNNTLINGDCNACAVGNLVADSMGLHVLMDGDTSYWGRPEDTINDRIYMFYDRQSIWYQPQIFKNWLRVIKLAFVTREAMQQIRRTGYTYDEVMEIEHAFENAEYVHNEEGMDTECLSSEDFLRMEDEGLMYAGLLAVVDVLAKIHGVDLTTSQGAATSLLEIHQARVIA